MKIKFSLDKESLDEPLSLVEFGELEARRDLHAVACWHVVHVHPSEEAAVLDLRKLAAICALYLYPCHN